MKILVALDGSAASLAAVEHVKALARKGVRLQALLLHVQVRFSRHVSQFSRRRLNRKETGPPPSRGGDAL